jgi:hypothetical protein
MRDGNPHQPASVHLPHLGEKIGPVIRPSLQNVKLPLMNHFVGQGAQELLLGIGRPGCELLEQRQGQSDAAALGSLVSAVPHAGTWPHLAREHADRRSQTAAPPHLDWGQSRVEIPSIQLSPTGLQPLGRSGQAPRPGSGQAGCLHNRGGVAPLSCFPQSSSRIEAAKSGTMIS